MEVILLRIQGWVWLAYTIDGVLSLAPLTSFLSPDYRGGGAPPPPTHPLQFMLMSAEDGILRGIRVVIAPPGFAKHLQHALAVEHSVLKEHPEFAAKYDQDIVRISTALGTYEQVFAFMQATVQGAVPKEFAETVCIFTVLAA